MNHIKSLIIALLCMVAGTAKADLKTKMAVHASA